MVAHSKTGFYYRELFGSALSRHNISFQSGAINSTTGMSLMGNHFGVGSTAHMMLQGNSSTVNNSTEMVQVGNSPRSLLLDSVPGLNHDTNLAVEWSPEEQYRLEEGLAKYAYEPNITRYIKIAATLCDKTVRDVAMRCSWMGRKRRKSEQQNVGKKVNTRKEKLVESSSKTSLPSAALLNDARYSPMMHHMDQNERMPFEVPGNNGTTKHLLEQNAQAFNQIAANLSTLKFQDNMELFHCTRNNITAILNDMRDMPGVMNQMPPLPVYIDNDLANSMFHIVTQSTVLGSPSRIRLKQEPRY